MQRPTKEELYKSIDVIMTSGAIIYLLALSFFMSLAMINGSWAYTSDWGTGIEIILILIFVSYFSGRVFFLVRSMT